MTPNPRTITINTTNGPRTCTITDTPHANEWPTGDPIPTDKETLGHTTRHPHPPATINPTTQHPNHGDKPTQGPTDLTN